MTPTMVHADIGPEKLRPRIAETFNLPSSTSNMKAVRANIEEFDTKIAEAVSRSNNVYVVFFGTEVPETSESWCPGMIAYICRSELHTHCTHTSSQTVLLPILLSARLSWTKLPRMRSLSRLLWVTEMHGKAMPAILTAFVSTCLLFQPS